MHRRCFLKSCLSAAALALTPSVAAAARFIGPGVRIREARLLMGTLVTIHCVADSGEQARQAAGATFEEMERLSALLSRYDSSSALSVLNETGRIDHAPDELLSVLAETRRVHRSSGSAFDPTVAPLMTVFDKWDGTPGALDRDDFRAALELVGESGVSVSGRRIAFARSGMSLTLDGAAKGYITDRAAEVLERCGVTNFLIDSGGDILARGHAESGRCWRVGVQHPSLDPHAGIPASVELRNRAAATSGGYETARGPNRAFNHILDPRTGFSPRTADSATVLAPTVLQADALSTAVFAMGPDRGLRMIDALPDCEALVITPGGGRHMSAGWV